MNILAIELSTVLGSLLTSHLKVQPMQFAKHGVRVDARA